MAEVRRRAERLESPNRCNCAIAKVVGRPADALGVPLGQRVLVGRRPAAVHLEPLVGVANGLFCSRGQATNHAGTRSAAAFVPMVSWGARVDTSMHDRTTAWRGPNE